MSSVCNTFYLHPSAVPPVFQEEVTSKEAVEGGTATLHCKLSKAPAHVQWKKGHHVLTSDNKYSMRQEGCVVELVVHDLDLSDTGDYTCVCGDKTTTATLTVHGKVILGTEVLQTSDLPKSLLLWSVPAPFLFPWAFVFLCTVLMCFFPVYELGEKLPGWCWSSSAVFGSSCFPCPEALSMEAEGDFSIMFQ